MNGAISMQKHGLQLRAVLAVTSVYLLTEGMFNWMVIGNSLIIEGYEKVLGLGVYALLLWRWHRLQTDERIVVMIFSVLLTRLVLESMAQYDSWFRQLTMFTVLFPTVYCFFIKFVLRTMKLDLLGFVSKFYLWVYIVFMLVFGRSFSFGLETVEMKDYGPFSGDSRVIHASHIYMMIIPMLWYLDRFLSGKRWVSLLPVIFCLGVIVIHQHRSVWSCALLALALFVFIRVRAGHGGLRPAFRLLTGAAALLAITVFFLINLSPGFLSFLGDRFNDILDPAREGSTGNFRIAQRTVYFQLFLRHPVFGWTFEGFSMANPLVDWWPPETGQHFHDGYIEMLFYHGLAGLLFKYLPLVWLCRKIFSRNLSREAAILLPFCVSGLLFSFNYVLPLVFWGHLGMCLYYLGAGSGRQPDQPATAGSLSRSGIVLPNNHKKTFQ